MESSTNIRLLTFFVLQIILTAVDWAGFLRRSFTAFQNLILVGHQQLLARIHKRSHETIQGCELRWGCVETGSHRGEGVSVSYRIGHGGYFLGLSCKGIKKGRGLEIPFQLPSVSWFMYLVVVPHYQFCLPLWTWGDQDRTAPIHGPHFGFYSCNYGRSHKRLQRWSYTCTRNIIIQTCWRLVSSYCDHP